MRFMKSLNKKFTRFCLSALLQKVGDGKIRPFCIDKDGLWFNTEYGFSVFSDLVSRILELETNPVWESKESDFIVNNIKEADVFIDVGANIGYFSMLAAKQKVKKILAFEPVPKTFDMLTLNIRHNNFNDIIKAFNIALGSKEHVVKCISSLGPKNHIEYQKNNIHTGLSTIDIKISTLDRLLKDEKEVKSVDFIKIDVEGYEYEFLQGARETIGVFKPMILMEIEEHRLAKYNASAQQVFDFLSDLDYKYLFIGEDCVGKGNFPVDDLKKTRNFVFYTEKHNPLY